MAIVTAEEVEKALGKRLNRILNLDDDDDPKEDIQLIEAIKHADGFVETGLRKLYKIPLAPSTPEEVKAVATDIILWRLQSNRPEIRNDLDEANYDKALRWLRDAGDGKIEIKADRVDASDNEALGQSSAVVVGSKVTHETKHTATSPTWFADL